MKYWLVKSRLLLVMSAFSALIAVGLVACANPEPTATPRPAATATPRPDATATPRPEATATPRPAAATATPRPAATATPSSSVGSDPESTVIRAWNRLEPVYGIGYQGPYRTPATNQWGGVEESFFIFDNGSPLSPQLIDEWKISPAGDFFVFTIKRLPNGEGIPFQAPRGFEDFDFGVLDAEEVVEWFNRSNAFTNPESTYGDGGDLRAIFEWARIVAEDPTGVSPEDPSGGFIGKAFVFGEEKSGVERVQITSDQLGIKFVEGYTVYVDLASPVFFCLPISQFGCLSAARGPHKVTTADDDSKGFEWARAHHVGTGPYVQGERCVAGDRCTLHAVSEHWRKVPNVATLVGVHIPEAQTRVASLRNGSIDMAEVDYGLLLSNLVADSRFKFIETLPGGGFVGQSILFPGNLWEEFHAISGAPLRPWQTQDNHKGTPGFGTFPYEKDYPWIGNPWGTADQPCKQGTPGLSGPKTLANGESYEGCGDASYTDTNNPDGIDDMEQARLVRLALSMAVDRDAINLNLLQNVGTPIYSEYMGPEYPGWDASKQTLCYDWLGEVVECTGTLESIPWELPTNFGIANRLLDDAGYEKDSNGTRTSFSTITLQAYAAEAGPVGLDVAQLIIGDWQKLGLTVEGSNEDYGGVISPRMRRREQFLPVLKNGDVHSNLYPLDWPLPTVDTSRSRPGWGVGFESQAGAGWLSEILAERDISRREELHQTWVDYSLFWVQYAGVFQVPKGIVSNNRVASWEGFQQHYQNVSTNPEFIVLSK